MRCVTVHDRRDDVIIEIDGDLGIVSGHELHELFGLALSLTHGTLSLDLSRVTGADQYGLHALRWCSDHAIAAHRILNWSTYSQPFARDLNASSSSTQQPHWRAG